MSVPEFHGAFEVRDVRGFDEVMRINGHHRIVLITRLTISLLQLSDTFLHDLEVGLLTCLGIEHFIGGLARVRIKRVRVEVKVRQGLRVTAALSLTYPRQDAAAVRRLPVERNLSWRERSCDVDEDVGSRNQVAHTAASQH